MEGTIRIKLVRSPICTPEKHKRVVKGLGLRKLNQIVERPDTAVFRGMVVSSTCTLRRFFLAASMPLRIALGTSLALPTP